MNAISAPFGEIDGLRMAGLRAKASMGGGAAAQVADSIDAATAAGSAVAKQRNIDPPWQENADPGRRVGGFL
jgi:hypothetical protein